MRKNALNWFNNYLTKRTQLVKYAKNFSTTTLEVKSDVPQGPNLGPILFLEYVNDFKNCLNDSDSLMFADDTSILSHNKDIKKLFDGGNKELELVDRWLIANKLSMSLNLNTFYKKLHNPN